MQQTELQRISVEQSGEITIVTFLDANLLDEKLIDQLGEELQSLVHDRCKIILDFNDVTYLSSATLGKLIFLEKKAKVARGQLRLCSLAWDILEVFSLTSLDKFFSLSVNRFTAVVGL